VQPAVVARTRGLVAASGLLERLVTLPARPASTEELLRVHDAAWLGTLERTAATGGGMAGVNVPVGAVAVIEELLGSRTGIEDPYFPPDRELAYDALQDHQRRAIEAAAPLK
jgi:hypothetical protein